VTLAERYGGTVVSHEIYDAMVDEVATFVESFATTHRPGLARFHMLGTSGTVTTIAGVYLKLKALRPPARRRLLAFRRRDFRRGGRAPGDELRRTCGEPLHRRRARRPSCWPACAILDAIRRAFPCPRLRVADRGLREGMLVEMMRADGVWGEA